MYSSLYGSSRQPGLARGLPIWISPPLSISSEETDDMMRRLLAMLAEWEGAVLHVCFLTRAGKARAV